VRVEGQFVGKLEGFRFAADRAETAHGARAVSAAAQRALRGEIRGRVQSLTAAPDEAFALDEEGRLLWEGSPVGRLTPGPTALRPQVEVLASDLLEPAERDALRKRLSDFISTHLRAGLKPLFALEDSSLTGAAKGLVFQLTEGQGCLPRAKVLDLLGSLSEADRKNLARLNVRLGTEAIYSPDLLKPGRQHLNALLWAIFHNQPPQPTPPPGRVSFTPAADMPAALLRCQGYWPLGSLAIRIDMLERFAAQARAQARQEGGLVLTPALTAPLGLNQEQGAAVLAALGFRRQPQGEDGLIRYLPARQKKHPGKDGRQAQRRSGKGQESGKEPGANKTTKQPETPERPAIRSDSPFACLRDL